MRLDRQKDECMATKILERNGFKLITPDESLVTNQVWEKDGERWRFTGWENTPNTALMAANPKYINIEKLL
jgi:hypothetical protein